MEYARPPILDRLSSGRMHEACGPGRSAFAVMRVLAEEGPVVWIASPRSTARLCPQALMRFFDPARLIVIHPPKPKDALWCMEEALRAGPAFVIADLVGTADLTESRRLQLAARAGGATGLCLIPDGLVNNAAETRWRCTPLPAASEATLQHWELKKNKKGILGGWNVCWDAASRSVHVVSVSGGGAGLAAGKGARSGPALRGGGAVQERLAALLGQPGG